ncbi:hypothetical protein Godav_027910 [Gossypium davidsonii]|uniref:Uncharacterized protein n=2 Tax=Gossypium TaxID=3633 RepID=A0A7J8RYH4_GOSDV|nr:hypothetical protein [Gossypium davidsonii]MBA0653959.1 hypothetical protein [Gossypium klotzschianum]
MDPSKLKCCVSGQKVRTFFPHLVMALCKTAEVPMEENERKENMDVPALLKRKVKPTSRQERSESTSEKIDRMIRWMQERGPILQDFVRRNNMRIPNYPPDMFGPDASRA